MTDDDPGTGGLTLEAPRAPDDDAAPIGFAPDLDDDDAPASGLWAEAAPAASTPTSSAAAAAQDARLRRGQSRYPIAEATLDRLLGLVATPEPSAAVATSADDASFAVGPDIMRPPPDISRPTPPGRPEGAATVGTRPAEAMRTDELMDDMVEMMLVGDDEDGGGQQIHLAFKEDIFGGLYLKLARTDAGLFATFLVRSDSERRAVDGNVEMLLVRLRDRGMKIAGHAIEVRDD